MTTLPLPHAPHHRPPDDRPGTERSTMTKHDAERYVLTMAGVVIVALTGGAFWLSYAHLADVAGQHGLGNSPIRRWAWPATLDAFIVAGELLMLRASLRRVTDGWAIAVTAIGSVGSIALNVAGVSGTDNASTIPVLDYVVAAVPPAAAMVAFGVLMRQIHQLVEHSADDPDAGSVHVPEPPVTASAHGPAPAAASDVSAGQLLNSPVERTEPPSAVTETKSSGGRPPKATIAELADIGRTTARRHGKLTRGLLREAVKDRDLTIGSERQTEVMELLRPELEAVGIEVSKR
ncbi:DUF2637 domain-containing protein [Streptomyces sp. NPDC050516]|uniref:DUF2637 domain-containing protein n=1 Tax=Streptomyces sp. NPDC050516 TaxID=3365621 RepID=UPI00379055D5